MEKANLVQNFKSSVIIEQTHQLIQYLKNNGGISESTKILKFMNESDNFYDICAMLVGANVLEEIQENDKTLLKLKSYVPQTKSDAEVQTGHERVCGIIEMNKKNKQRKIHCRHCMKQYSLHNWHMFTAHLHQTHMDHLEFYHITNKNLPLNAFNHARIKAAVIKDLSKTQTDSMKKIKVKNIEVFQHMPVPKIHVNNISNTTIDATTTNCNYKITETNTGKLSTVKFLSEIKSETLKCTCVMNTNIGPELKRLVVPKFPQTTNINNLNTVTTINKNKETTATELPKVLLTRFPISVKEFLKIQTKRLFYSEDTNKSVDNVLETLQTIQPKQIKFILNKPTQFTAKAIVYKESAQPATILLPQPSNNHLEPTKNIKINVNKELSNIDCTITELPAGTASSNTDLPAQHTKSTQNRKTLVENELANVEIILPDFQTNNELNETSQALTCNVEVTNKTVDYKRIISKFPVTEIEVQDTSNDGTANTIKITNDKIRKDREPANSTNYLAHTQNYSKATAVSKIPLKFDQVQPITMGTTTNINTPTTVNTVTTTKTNSNSRRKYVYIKPKPTTVANYNRVETTFNELPNTTSTTNRKAKRAASVMSNFPITTKKIKYARRKMPSKITPVSVYTKEVKSVATAMSSYEKPDISSSKKKTNTKSIYDKLKAPLTPSPPASNKSGKPNNTQTLYVNLKEPASASTDKTHTELIYAKNVKKETPLYIKLKEPRTSANNVKNTTPLFETRLTTPATTSVPMKSKRFQSVISICKIPAGITIKRVPRSTSTATYVGNISNCSKIVPSNNSLAPFATNDSVLNPQIVRNPKKFPTKIANEQFAIA